MILSLRTSPSGRKGELSILTEPDGTGVWRELIEEFNQQDPDFPVRLVEGPPGTNSREDMYSTSFLSQKSSLDIVYCDVIWVAKFAAAGWLLDLTARLSREDRRDFLAIDLEAGSYRGRLYRIPAFVDAGMLYYRKDLVATPPQTFEELLEKSRKLQTQERWGFLWQGKQYEGLITVFLEVLWGFGGDWIDPDTKRVHIDSPEALEALRFLKSTIGTVSPPGVTGYIEEDTRLLFQSGRGVFLRNWSYVGDLMRRSKAPVADQTANTTMVHASGRAGAATLGGWGFAISSFCPNPERAWMFVEFMTRPRQLTRVQRSVGRIPSRKSLMPPEFLRIAETARMRPPIPKYAQASDILQRWLSAALTGRVDDSKALHEAARETRILLEGGSSKTL